jgi:hypothetical protein
VHAALEGRYGHGLDPVTVLRAVYDKAAEDYPGYEEELGKEYDFALAITEGYLQWLAETGADAGLVPLEAERVITVAFAVINDVSVILQARIDAVLERKDNGEVILLDHKTTASLESKQATLAINEQAKTQALIQRLDAAARPSEVDYTVDGVVFNLLKKSKRTERAKPPFYMRVPLPFSEAEMQSTWRRVHKTVTEIVELRQALDAAYANPGSTAEQREEMQQYHAPPTPSEDCSWRCPFLQVCPMMDDGSRWEDALEANYERGDPYQYLDSGLLDELRKAGRV